MVNSGRVSRVGDLRDIFKKEEEEMMMVVTKTTFLDDDDEKSEEEEEIVETERQEDGEEEEEKGGDDEEEDKEENVYEVSVRVLGTLESFDASNSVGVLKDDAFAPPSTRLQCRRRLSGS